MSIKCYKCKSSSDLEAGAEVIRSDDCDTCGTDLRCCKMCEFYDKNSYNECREPMADRITEKEKANFCDFFKLGSGSNGNSTAINPVDAANALFKK